MTKNKAKQVLMTILGGIEMSVLIMIAALSPLSFIYFLGKFLENGSTWNLFLSITGLIATIVSGLLFTALIIYSINLQLEYLGISKPLLDLDKLIKHILEQNEKQQQDK
jgi:hypothetical protein